ncbi:39S ribosomal protein S18a, mitochondrial [Lutzomyia longipalpis]|uniref:39S ribosomal protein S18a, mitochondrial n=1 Tax=Lutzomyia longipalpis TaxID=7200 RepID=UPI0024844C01|nr:39S ribosomal protein S18a, mitochondrial [Lutzomyia longipalpis]
MSYLRNSLKDAIKLSLNGINQSSRTLTTTASLRLKEIKTTQDKNHITIEGIMVKSPREEFQVTQLKEARLRGEKFCPKCTLGLDVKHTDVLILSQYVRSDGCMLPRRITGLCSKQQRRMSILVAMAQKAGLMSNLTPENSKKDPKLRFKWKKFNTYFEEHKTKEMKYL